MRKYFRISLQETCTHKKKSCFTFNNLYTKSLGYLFIRLSLRRHLTILKHSLIMMYFRYILGHLESWVLDVVSTFHALRRRRNVGFSPNCMVLCQGQSSWGECVSLPPSLISSFTQCIEVTRIVLDFS